MRSFKRGAVLALATVAALAGTFATGSQAMAASSPIAACGGGSYHVIDKHDLGKAVAYLMYNGDTNCVVTWKKRSNSINIMANTQAKGGAFKIDHGKYKYYAGPAKVSTKGKCIK
ncbi:hypothetical protein ACIBF6_42420 [Streptosporangium amethystogenes]|uniref:hypothetical protein n=1 Tax=Streptosporangium amethystogenes TaxID=2002 RepID=UPI0037B5E46C